MHDTSASTLPRYAIVTAARNEASYIRHTLESVAAQTHSPIRWIIVSDGSTDDTDSIVAEFARRVPWIILHRMPDRAERSFAAKAHCVNAAYAMLQPENFSFIVNLDADVSFEPDYFAFVLGKFESRPTLGVAGTPYVEGPSPDSKHAADHRFADLRYVSGPCQVFRRTCFDQVGGYRPIKGGAVDWIAVQTARMNGWETWSFPEKTYRHHRKMGTAECGVLYSSFLYGAKAYKVGGHPLWELLRGLFQMRKSPFVLGGIWFQTGYLWAAVRRTPRVVTSELMAFHRTEQLNRLRRIFHLRQLPVPVPVGQLPGSS